jgi:hypothetical protein
VKKIIEEYDEQGNLKKKTIIEKNESEYDYIPYYPYIPTETHAPWKITYDKVTCY